MARIHVVLKTVASDRTPTKRLGYPAGAPEVRKNILQECHGMELHVIVSDNRQKAVSCSNRGIPATPNPESDVA